MTTRRDKKVECPDCGKLFDVNRYPQCPECKKELKNEFYAFLVCAFMIIGVPIIINLLIWPDVGIWSIIK